MSEWMVGVEITINGTAHYVSDVGAYIEDEWYFPYIINIGNISYGPREQYGGFIEVSYGSITLSPEIFNGAGDWPPPRSCAVDVNVHNYVYPSTHFILGLFKGEARLKSFDKEQVVYDLYRDEIDTPLLDTDTDYDGNTVVLPRAFGEVEHVRPVRLADVASAPTYHKGYITGTIAASISSLANYFDSEIIVSFSAPHGLVSTFGDSITVEGSENISGVYTSTQWTLIDTTTIHIAGTYVAPTSDDIGHVYQSGYWRVYDDGVPISSNVTDNGDGTFSLSAVPVGEVTISGPGDKDSMQDVFGLAIALIDPLIIPYYTHMNDQSIDHVWQDSQVNVVDFISDMAAFFGHAVSIDFGFLIAYDLINTDVSTHTLDDFSMFGVSYRYNDQVGIIKSKWTERRAVNQLSTGRTVIDEEKEAFYNHANAGKEMSVAPWTTNRTNLVSNLQDIADTVNALWMEIRVPLNINPSPRMGYKVSFVDTAVFQTISKSMRLRNFTYDVSTNNFEMVIEGQELNANTDTLTASNITTGFPVIGAPTLTENGAAVSARYWRIRATSDSLVSALPKQLTAYVISGYTSTDGTGTDLFLSKTVDATTEFSATYSAEKAVDGDGATYWATEGTPAGFQSWWVDLATAQEINSIKIDSYFATNRYFGATFAVDYSANGTDWNELCILNTANAAGIQTFSSIQA